jgi:hypothetical protein
MSARELCVLVEELPDDSRFKRTQAAAWTLVERLLAASLNVEHGLREDYRGRHGADYEYTPVEMPELDGERDHRAEQQHRRQLARQVFEGMLSGRLRMSEIDVHSDIEEVLRR